MSRKPIVRSDRTAMERYLRKLLEQKQQQIIEIKQQLAEKDCRIEELEGQFAYECECNKQLVELQKQLAEKDKEIEDLKQWEEWYSMWHKKFQKQIEDLTTELETYRPTKLHGNGQCKCFNCNAINWTDWCSKYKGHTYCDVCLKDILKEEQAPQTQLAIQELEKIKNYICDCTYIKEPDYTNVRRKIDNQIKELKGE